jgi:hypothetical protein
LRGLKPPRQSPSLRPYRLVFGGLHVLPQCRLPRHILGRFRL